MPEKRSSQEGHAALFPFRNMPKRELSSFGGVSQTGICTTVTRCLEVSAGAAADQTPNSYRRPGGSSSSGPNLLYHTGLHAQKTSLQTWRCHVFFGLPPCRLHLCLRRKDATVPRNSRTLGFAETSLSRKAGACPSRARHARSNVRLADTTAAPISETRPKIRKHPPRRTH